MNYADKINAHLRDNGVVLVDTYNRTTQYDSRHAGFFFIDGKGDLRVRHGKKSVCLSNGERLLVGVRFGHFAQV